jgi:hypothetical protein
VRRELATGVASTLLAEGRVFELEEPSLPLGGWVATLGDGSLRLEDNSLRLEEPVFQPQKGASSPEDSVVFVEERIPVGRSCISLAEEGLCVAEDRAR